MSRTEILVLFSLFAYASSLSNYGPFNLTMTKVNFCNGPKRRDCTQITAKIINGTTLLYDMNITENMKDLHTNLFAISENKQAVRMQMKKICDHPFWLPFFKKYVTITDDCVLLKGVYHMEANAQELAERYYGGSFLYGKWQFKSVTFNKNCNFGCTIIDIVLTPK